MKQSVFLTAIDRLSGSEIEFGRGPFTIADLNILFFLVLMILMIFLFFLEYIDIDKVKLGSTLNFSKE